MAARREFDRLVLDTLLPAFCEHYGYDGAGFRTETLDRITEHDAHWFLTALRTETVSHKLPFFFAQRSRASEQIFWQGRKTVSPRPITIWVEPVIGIGAAGRLHGELSWPAEQIGLQSDKNWAFDVVAYHTGQAAAVVCEVKKSRREVDDLIEAMVQYAAQPPNRVEPAVAKLRNAYRKVRALKELKPEFVWILGPADYGMAFRWVPDAAMMSGKLEKVDVTELRYRGSE